MYKVFDNKNQNIQIEEIIFNEQKQLNDSLADVSFATLGYDPVGNENGRLIRELAFISGAYNIQFGKYFDDDDRKGLKNLLFTVFSPEFNAQTGKFISSDSKNLSTMLGQFRKIIYNEIAMLSLKNADKTKTKLASDPPLEIINDFKIIKSSILNVFNNVKTILQGGNALNTDGTTRFSGINDRVLFSIIYHLYMKRLAAWVPFDVNFFRNTIKVQKHSIGVIIYGNGVKYDDYFNELNSAFTDAQKNGVILYNDSQNLDLNKQRLKTATQQVAALKQYVNDYYDTLKKYIDTTTLYFTDITSALNKIAKNSNIITGDSEVPKNKSLQKASKMPLVFQKADPSLMPTLTSATTKALKEKQELTNQQRAFQMLTQKIGAEFASNYNKQQLLLANKSLDLLESKINDESSAFVDESLMKNDTRNALHSMLKDDSFYYGRFKSDDTRILTVGLPLGFSSFYRKNIKSIENYNSNSTNTLNQQDIISVNVYKQNVQYSKVIFKPKRFEFELSRFCIDSIEKGKSVFDLTNRETNFDKIIDMFPTFNYEYDLDIIDNQNSGYIKNNVKPKNELGGDEYKFLTTGTKQNIRKNHVIDYLLYWYLKYLIGLDFDESSFTVLQQYNTNTALQDDSLISDLGIALNIPSEQLEYLKLFSTKSILKTGERDQISILAPKKYERIFNVPINPNDFIVDDVATKSSQAGKKQLDELAKKPKDQTHVNGFNIKYHKNDISLIKYWVDISTIKA